MCASAQEPRRTCLLSLPFLVCFDSHRTFLYTYFYDRCYILLGLPVRASEFVPNPLRFTPLPKHLIIPACSHFAFTYYCHTFQSFTPA